MNHYAGTTTWLRPVLVLLGIAGVGYYAIRQNVVEGLPTWAFVAVLIVLAAWLAYLAVPRSWRTASLVCSGIMVVAGGFAAVGSDGVTIVPVAVGVLQLASDPRRPLRIAAGFGLLALILVPLGAIGVPTSPIGIATMEGAIIVLFLAGQSRRQFVVAREEQARADVLAARQNIAHDIHDVLAHSLGGLVIQLDAVDALLEAGDLDAAAARVRDSRALAAEGLSEARRAVDALRGPQEASTRKVAASDLIEGLDALLAAHRSLGGEVRFGETGARHEVAEPLASAIRRALQEGLTNARKHASGTAVTVRLEWTDDTVALTIENPLATPNAKTDIRATGGGHGLVGMRERFAGLGGEATAGEVSDDDATDRDVTDGEVTDGEVTDSVGAGRFVVEVRGSLA